ncbi:hypothetical protein CASFOL_032628 [Castilleja foliolosa]|uniref:DUF6821 domain-containing protein n=1 Tax=Castilleja foliolosa TaxID=1961234 RepID=A0ABD3C2M0_9LAMI
MLSKCSMKSLTKMDLEDWELLLSDEYPKSSLSPSSPTVFQMNHFICPPKPVENTNNQLLPVTIDLQPQDQAPIQITSDPNPVSQVFFKKTKETEFVDMKLDSLKSLGSSPGIMPKLDFQFGENREEEDNKNNVNINEGDDLEMDHEDEGEGGFNIWKWGLTGIGAICSFGVVAATFCLISTQRNHPRHNHKLHFQIYTNDKRMKRVVDHASKVNEGITRAHITFGGYYDASSL